jgi:hypothetical protein
MRRTTLLGLAAAAFWTAAPDPARAEYWYALGPYRCHRSLSEYTDWLRYELIGSGGIRECQALCDRTSGCVAFQYRRRVSPRLDKATEICILYGRYDNTHNWRSVPGPFDSGTICYRHHDVWDKLPSEWRNRLSLEQDQLHPGLRPSVPSGPNKP